MTPERVTVSLSDASEDGDWLEEEQEEEMTAVISLLDDRVFPDPLSMIDYCKEKFGFDFLGYRKGLQLDFLGTVKLINFVRQRVHEGLSIPKNITLADIEDDLFLKPVIDDDALILCLDDLPHLENSKIDAEKRTNDAAAFDRLVRENEELREELERLNCKFSNFQHAVHKTLNERWGTNDDDDDEPGTKGPATGPVEDKGAGEAKGGREKDDVEYYFESYAHNEIHETMLKDTVRTDAYRDFIYTNKHLFAGKIVLDVGCGTGILSMFCAKAGASKVFAVDQSDIINKTREVIFSNGFGDQIVCLKGRMEDISLPVAQVDILVSEWMGYFLTYEAMLPSIIWARDRYLRPDGLLVPSHASMWIAPACDAGYVAEHVSFWKDVYGFDMSKPMLKDVFLNARVQSMPMSSVCGSANAFRFLDLYSTKVEDLVFSAPWHTELAAGFDRLDGFLIWFDVFFSRRQEDDFVPATITAAGWAGGHQNRVAFTTGPMGQETHWRQGLLLVDADRQEEIKKASDSNKKAGSSLRGTIKYAAPENHARGLTLSASWRFADEPERNQTWLLH